MTPLAASLAHSPELFPLLLDLPSDKIAFVRLTEEDYTRASFLDHRLQDPKIVRTLSFHALQNAVAETSLDSRAQFIFHISHVGSTLMTRLLGAHPNVFALRQPGITRPLTYVHLESAKMPTQWRGEQFDARLLALLKLWSRTFRPTQQAIVKVPSFVCELAKRIFAQPHQPKAICMFMSPERHLANILRSQHSIREAKGLASMRLMRLNNRIGTDFNLEDMSFSEIVAMSWASEMTTMSEAATEFPDRVLWLDFDKFLATPEILLGQCFTHLGITASPAEIDTILAGPQMRQYSKAPGQQYDASVRNTEMNESQEKFREEIQQALQWLEKAASRHSLLTQAMALSSAS
jgi:hypothetical protein